MDQIHSRIQNVYIGRVLVKIGIVINTVQGAQEGKLFRIPCGVVEQITRRQNMQPEVRNWVQLILNAMHEFVFPQVTHNEPQSCDKCNCFRIMTMKNTISRWSDKFKDAVSNKIETA